MIHSANNKSCSATVNLTLHAVGVDHELAKVGRNRIVLRSAIELPPCDGVLSITIDGHTLNSQFGCPRALRWIHQWLPLPPVAEVGFRPLACRIP
jgi:hypothetical protein